jgi:hypothetical protein
MNCASSTGSGGFQIEAPPQNWDGVFTAEEK